MTGPEHYKEAERLIETGVYDEDGDEKLLARDIAVAQVHATLALAAATAMNGYGGGSDNGMHVRDFNVWDEACGIPPRRATDG